MGGTPIKILLVGTGLVAMPPERGGGVESHILELARGLAAVGHEIHVVSDFLPEEVPPDLTFHSIRSPIDRFPLSILAAVPGHLLAGTLTSLAVRRAIRGEDFDVIHAHEEVSAALLLRMGIQIPIVFTVHNPWPQVSRFGGVLETLCRAAAAEPTMGLVLRKSDHIVSLTGVLKQWLVDRRGFPAAKISHIPHPVQLRMPRGNGESRQSMLSKYRVEPPYCLFVGRIDERKGAGLLLRAFMDARSRMDDPLSLVFVGDGALRPKLQSYVGRNGFRNSVRFLGQIPGEDLETILSGADMFALPTLAEAAPLALAEAMAHGVPAISSDIPVIRDIARHDVNALLAPPGDLKTLSQLLCLLSEDGKLRARLGRNARAFVEQRLGPEIIARQTTHVYTRAIAG